MSPKGADMPETPTRGWKRFWSVAAEVLLVLVIVGLLVATWLPAILDKNPGPGK